MVEVVRVWWGRGQLWPGYGGDGGSGGNGEGMVGMGAVVGMVSGGSGGNGEGIVGMGAMVARGVEDMVGMGGRDGGGEGMVEMGQWWGGSMVGMIWEHVGGDKCTFVMMRIGTW